MDTKNLAKEFCKWANFEWTGFGCDVCGYGTIEETDFDPYKPCPECGETMIQEEDRDEKSNI